MGTAGAGGRTGKPWRREHRRRLSGSADASCSLDTGQTETATQRARVLRDPDFILRGNKPHTALVIKQIVEEDAITEVVLRLKVSSDPAAYRNSIITLWHISPKRFHRLLRQSEILYKKE